MDYKSMTVAELISKLSELPQDYRIDIPVADWENNSLLINDVLDIYVDDDEKFVSLMGESVIEFFAEEEDCICSCVERQNDLN